MRWLIRGVLGVLALLALAVGAGAVWQAVTMRTDAERYPMPGALVDVGGRALHLYCTGQGTPLVLLENGLGANYATWLRVQPGIAAFTRVCSYDRAGMGWSDPSPRPTRADTVADDLHALCTHAHLDGPVVLVGWSAGGVFARRYRQRHPQDVVGMVFVDSSHEQQGLRLPRLPDQAAIDEANRKQLTLCRTLAWTGAVRALGVFDGIAEAQHIPASVRGPFVALENRTEACAGLQHELDGFAADVRDRAPPQPLGGLPLVVLTRGLPASANDWPAPTTPAFRQRADATWWQLQSELAALSSHARHLRVAGSGHAIPVERPDAVVDAVRTLVLAQRAVAHAGP